MKMRFWQKTYIFTLAIFLICLNIGILSLTLYTYRKNMEAVETAVAAEQYYVAMSFERDYEALLESSEITISARFLDNKSDIAAEYLIPEELILIFVMSASVKKYTIFRIRDK